jgi:hypothetical protein
LHRSAAARTAGEPPTKDGVRVSHVTNVLLAVQYLDRPTSADFVAWLEAECPRADPRDPDKGCGSLNFITGADSQWGGAKSPTCSVYAGTLNGADPGAVVAQFGRTGWHFPKQVQLLLRDQDESTFRLWMIDDGGPRQYAPIRDLTLDDVMPP